MTRAHPRYATAVRVVLGLGADEVEGETSNLSIGGLCAEIDRALELGDETAIRLSLVFASHDESEPIEVEGRVVWCTPIDVLRRRSFQLGIQFTRVSPGAAGDLSLFLRFLAGKSEKQ